MACFQGRPRSAIHHAVQAQQAGGAQHRRACHGPSAWRLVWMIGMRHRARTMIPKRIRTRGYSATFFTNCDFSPIWPMPGILQSMS